MKIDPLSNNWSLDSALDLFHDDFLVPLEPSDYALDPWVSGFLDEDSDEDPQTQSPETQSQSQSQSQSPQSPLSPLSLSPLSPLQLPQPQPPLHLQSQPPPRPQSRPQSPPQHQPQRQSQPPPQPKSKLSLQPPQPKRNAAKRAAHNVIEKRYRTNMNAKFSALERAFAGDSRPKSAALKKSEILSNAIAYIQELQQHNRALQKQLQVLADVPL